MAKYLQIIGFWVLALALWQMASDSFIGTNPVGVEDSMGIQTVVDHQSDKTCFTSPQFPYLQEAELASSSGHVQLLTSSRLQRSYITEYMFSLRDCGEKLARREAALSLHKEKLFDATAYYRCQPVCEYYIFTLRRILI